MQRVEIFKEEKCAHPNRYMRANALVCIDCNHHDMFVTASELEKVKEEIAFLKQRSHTHKFSAPVICGECNEVKSLCMCQKFPPANC